MPRITPGNKLYLYRLFKTQIGIGKQERAQRFGEVLDEDDIDPEDLGCDDLNALLEALGDMIKLTVFKRGRVYATLQVNEEFEKALEAASHPAHKDKSAGGKSWKHNKKASKLPKPAKPRHRKPKAQPQPAAEAKAAAATEAQAEVEATAQAEQQATPEEKAKPEAAAATEQQPQATESAGEKNEAPQQEAAANAEATPEAAPEAEAAPASEPEPQAAPAPEAEPEPVPAPEPTPELEPEPTINLTITYDPEDDSQPEPEDLPAEGSFSFEDVRPTVAATPAAPAEEPAAPEDGLSRQSDLPQTISLDVHCKDEFLRALYQMLPLDVDVMSVLDEDWQVARSTALLTGTHSRVTFPLRYLHEDDGQPVTITLKRSARTAAGKRWSVACIDGDDGTGAMHEPVGIEGLPTQDEGAWSELCGPVHELPVKSPIREFAQFAMVGSWESYLGTLATMAMPEHWDYPGEGVGRASRYGILREYLCVTFHRARQTGHVALAEDGSLAAFDTGLYTPFSQDIYAVFTPNAGDIAWKAAGFCVAGSGQMGAELVAKLDPLPQPVTYLRELSDVVLDTNRLVVLDTDAILMHRLGVLPRTFLQDELAASPTATELLNKATPGAPGNPLMDLARAIKADPGLYRRLCRALDEALTLTLKRARASYRIAVPAYDPTADALRLLVPLCLVSDAQADCALVLAPQPSGNYRGITIMSLDRARVCARTVSAEQPAWLARPAASAGEKD
ncbi:MAG: DUF3825 domain-containing protein [Coriobacteriaceae bacterium]|nr:MAG: DUF3825 domain-containing protein [Coriobacteriaceae bacterium]